MPDWLAYGHLQQGREQAALHVTLREKNPQQHLVVHIIYINQNINTETDRQTDTHTPTFPRWNSVGLDFHNTSHVNIVVVTDDDVGMIRAQFTVGHFVCVRKLKVCS